MNIRARFAFWFALFVAGILSFTFTILYVQSSKLRKEEFFNRLQQKALTTQRLLIDVQEVDSTLLKIIDRNTLTTLTNERVLIFGRSDRLIYNSVDDDSLPFDYSLINRIWKENNIQYSDRQTGVQTIGMIVGNSANQYIVMASALDQVGLLKLDNLRNILVITWILGLGPTAILAYLYVRNIVGRPLSSLTLEIASIGENDLTKRIKVPHNQNELTTLAQNFNDLLDRLELAFESQRSFIQYASHELRTPLANMLSETESALSKDRSVITYQGTLHSLREEQSRRVELTNSLLTLTQYEKIHLTDDTPMVRIDEVLYNTIEELKTLTPEYKITLDFEGIPQHENDLVVKGNESLLRTAFRNLLENACRYGLGQSARIQIASTPEKLQIFFDNKGTVLTATESRRLFTPFFRGENSAGKRGYGMGLVIAQRILHIHGASIGYQNPSPDTNRFVVEITL
jgi:signal transduction histidine kinase